MKKFDIVLSNPPYTRNLDLKILESIFIFSKNIIFVHPTSFIFDKLFKCKLYNRIRNANHLKNIIILNCKKSLKMFTFYELCITEWDTSKHSNECHVCDNLYSNSEYDCKINEVSVHYGSLLHIKNDFNIFFNKLQTYECAYDKRVKPDYSDITDFSIKIPLIYGHPYDVERNMYTDMWNYCCKDIKHNYVDSTYRSKYKSDNTRICWSFSNKTERLNFAKYLNTKIVRFINSLTKKNQSFHMVYVPYLDFTQEWNDKKLCKEFEISEKLWNYIDNFIPNYYDDYVSGFEDEKI